MDEQKNKSEKSNENSSLMSNTQESTKEAIAPGTKEIDEMTTLHERVIASLSYISFLAIVPFYLKKDSAFCRFHGKQGLILAIIFFFASPLMVLDIVMDAVLIAKMVIFAIMGLAALSGKWKKLPFIYDYACQLEDTLSLVSRSEDQEKVKANETSASE